MSVIVTKGIEPLLGGRKPMSAKRLHAAAIAVARERQRSCEAEAKRHRDAGQNDLAATEQCAAHEARHIGDLLELLVPGSR